MFRRAAMLMGALLGSALAGCQNAPQQLSIYAPFGPSVVPTPSLTRANSTPYYTPAADPKTAPSSPATASSAGSSNGLSHYDPYRGLLVPGNFSPAPVAARSDETWGARDAALASAPRERASAEEPIRIVEGNSSTFVAGSGKSTSGSTLLSGAVRPLLSLPPPPASGGTAEIATRPRASSSPAPTTPATSPPALFSPPPANTPAPAPTTNPAEPRRLSLWDSPRDGSRVMPASHLEEAQAAPAPQAAGSWRVRD